MEFTYEELIIKQSELGRKINRVVENLKKSISQSKMTAGDVQSRLRSLEDNWSHFQRNHDVLILRHGEAVKATDYVKKEYADWVEERYLEQRGRLLDLAQMYGEGGSHSSSKGIPATSNEDAGAGAAPLPRMQLPEFHGEYVEWPAFKDLFLSIVERNRHLSSVDRLHYLKVSLHGQAADLVKDLPTTNENYERAWTILKEQYENKRILVRSCLDRLAAIPKMKESSAHEIANIQKSITSVANTLEGLGRPVDKTEDWFVYSVVNLFDPATRDKWEERVTCSNEPPSFATLKDYLIKRRQQIEASPETAVTRPVPRSIHCTNHVQPKTKEASRSVKPIQAQQSQRQECVMCRQDHFLMQCPEYKALSPAERRGRVEKARLCFNCLGRHLSAACPSTRSCMACGERHHSSIHDAFRDGARKTTTHHTLDCRDLKGNVLLATAVIRVADRHGRYQEVRALIDQGSEISMVTEGLAQRLQLTRTTSSVDIFGVGGQLLARARGRVNLDITATSGPDNIQITAIVLQKLTSYTHGCSAPRRTWCHLKGLRMADPEPEKSRPIEVLLGADVYPAIIKEGLRKGCISEPVGQLTMFGWILTGNTGNATPSVHARVHQVVAEDSLSSLVRKFWEQEEVPDARGTLTAEEQECERHFALSHTRTPDGRYQVRLPFRRPGLITSGSRTASWHALRRVEQRCNTDETFRSLYSSFMKEYLELGHMSLASDPVKQPAHYLPHHGVLKPSSTTTKLRVVFNGSWAGGTQLSLNDCLHVGPNLLPLLADVLLRWRMHQYVVTADITKMYRQILVHPEDRDFQRILWKDEESRQVEEYRLNTVTYGLSCAPYLAVRTVRQLAEDEGDRFPIGARALQNDTYVDDVLTGADSISALKEAAGQLLQLCKAGGFPLQKWASNAAELLDFTQQSCQTTAAQPLQDRDAQGPAKTWTDTTHSALGLQWSPVDDTFRFLISEAETQPWTKRRLVSKAAQLFDPLGWLTPVTVWSKISIQTTWLLGLDWDDPLPPTLAKDWQNFCTDFKQLEQVRVSRPMFQSSSPDLIEFHGFADASERAYGAVLYLRTKASDQKWALTLVAAKSKVAPLQQVSLPRLELCAAHLLARLTQHVTTTLKMTSTTVHLWSDSTVALGWIQGHPSKWKTYVANRVADIQMRVPDAHWHHVIGTENPADCASRGISPSQLLSWCMWWEGPEFLHREVDLVAAGPVEQEHLPEQKGPIVGVVTGERKEVEDNVLLTRFSAYTKLLRITAWCRRWLRKRRATSTRPPTNTTEQAVKQPVLTVAEITEAERGWIRLIQGMAYPEEKKMLAQRKGIPSRSSLAALAPILDEDNLLRVGGRLSKANLNPDETHPIILPPKSRFTQLLVTFTHMNTMHGGVQSTLGAIRQRFWIPKGRAIVKGTVHKCLTCVRWRAEPAGQMMGQLPQHRVTPTRPFHATGVDYAGPFWLRTSPGRGHKAYKGFLVVFVCMVTKAVHLEVASEYSTEAFLAAFRRFVSRRGICAHLYSDCGTNFKGADSELRSLFMAKRKENHIIREELSKMRTEWHFNPPAAPHFGGLWEAAVKSTKHHLRRVIGEARLTFEEMTTLLTQVEACLNSRPLTALSDDPTDLTALTPGHFLIGSALQAIPEPSLQDEITNRLTRWQLITKMRDQFWVRWKQEYLQGLTTRPKWRKEQHDVTIGRLCLIIDDQTPPSRWPLARVKETHPGKDGRVRVVTVTTANSEFVRPVHKLVILPIDTNDR